MSENATPPTGEGASARQLLFYEQATPVTAERHGTWSVELGRFQGTSPNTGTSYDEEALRLVGPRQTTTVVSGTAADLDRWLWGRGTMEPLVTDGDPTGADWIRTAARHATQ